MTPTEESLPMPGSGSMESTSDKFVQLEALRAEVSVCRKCSLLCDTRTQTVFNDGSPNAELCFVGEAPGADEDARGIPFVGKAGQLLTKIIEACQLQRSEVYICNVLKCRPPNNRNPSPEEIANCRPYLDRQLDLLRPKMMVALGKFAAAHLLGETPDKVPITKLRGSVHDYRGIPFMITLHPAYLLRNPSAKRDVWEDMKEVMRRLGRPVA
ncbi:uracil-DNA glycosylase [bacterium]|nr:uracil-DNA glycosylase [bacterium]